jgi:predicted SprT family Zn-dependent metalloprotease
MTNQQLITEATQKCLNKAQELYGVDLSGVRILFNLNGRAMGQARYKINRITREASDLQLRFNLRMCAEDMNDAIMDTVPHEVAHIVCAVNPRLGANHNPGWRNVCLQLGGTGKTYHDQEVIYAKGKTYAYTASCGKLVNLSEQRHKKVQRGATLRLKSGGTISKASVYRVVGAGGRRIKGQPTKRAGVTVQTTAQPEQKVAAKQPATPRPAEQPKPHNKMTKAELVRDVIGRCKRMDFDRSVAVSFAVDELNMDSALARKYVKNNWDKV